MTPPALLTATEAAALLHISTKTLQRLRSRGLPFVLVSAGTIRYRPDDVAEFISEKTQCHTAPRPRASTITTSRSTVVDFTDLVERKASKPPRR